MSSAPPHDEEDDLTAAELVLGLLPDADLRALRVRRSIDPGFAATVARWEERLAQLADEVAPVAPDAAMWDRIRAAVGTAPPAGGTVTPLTAGRGRLRAYAVAMTGIAASLALVIGYQQLRAPVAPTKTSVTQPTPERPAPLLATLASTQETTAVTVAFDPGGRTLTVIPARLPAQRNRARELWIIPAGGTPISLGVIRPGDPERRQLREDLARQFNSAATIAVSVEPAGGSPTGQPTGPVIATGTLVTA